jgi:hypothetical protein
MGNRLCPPARSFAVSPCSLNSESASGKLCGTWYSNGRGITLGLQVVMGVAPDVARASAFHAFRIALAFHNAMQQFNAIA